MESKIRLLREVFPQYTEDDLEFFIINHTEQPAESLAELLLREPIRTNRINEQWRDTELKSEIQKEKIVVVDTEEEKHDDIPTAVVIIPEEAGFIDISEDNSADFENLDLEGRRKLFADQVEKRLNGWKPKTEKYVNPTGGKSVNMGVQNEVRTVREIHRKRWLENRKLDVVTFSSLERKKQRYEESEGSETGADGNKVHTIQNTIYDVHRIGKDALKFTNDFRKQNNLNPLKWEESLFKIGQVHSKNMAIGKVPFGHSGFKGRVAQFPFTHSAAGENVAYLYLSTDVARGAVNGWIGSPGHRKNLLGNFTHCGIGVWEEGGKYYLTQLLTLKLY